MTDDVKSLVQYRYGETARSGLSTADPAVAAVAAAFGYSAEELASIPAEANMGLSCGNPTALAGLKAGEVVIDLGSGGGLDVFLAADKVGPEGRAIGIDMTPDMVALAKSNLKKLEHSSGNVEFILGTIDSIPLPDNTADVMISNCVINLAPDKDAVFREMWRVLKPGGRVAVSDIALKCELPEELRVSAEALVGCISGAIMVEDYQSGMDRAGFEGVTVVDSGADLNSYSKIEGQAGCCSPTTDAVSQIGGGSSSCCAPIKPVHAGLGELLRKYNVNEYAASVKVFARKPTA